MSDLEHDLVIRGGIVYDGTGTAGIAADVAVSGDRIASVGVVMTDRGVVRAGGFADLVVFDPARIRDTATYEDPRRFPEGIRAVYVNGTAVARDGEPTGARPGRALRRGA